MDISSKKKRQGRISDIDIYMAIPECSSARQVILKLGMDMGGKSHKRIKNIMNKHNLSYGKREIEGVSKDVNTSLVPRKGGHNVESDKSSN